MSAPDAKTIDSLQTHEDENVKRTAKEIQELTDTKDDNDKIELNWILTTKFADTLKKDPAIAKTLYDAIPEAKAWEDEGLTELRNFLEPIANPHTVEWTITSKEKPSDKAEKVQKITTFDAFLWENWSLKDIDKVAWLDQEIVTAINNIKIALEYPTKENIQNLQEFLYNNLSTKEEKQAFFNKNRADKNQKAYDSGKESGNWDGKIWSNINTDWSTAKTLNKFLQDTVDYIWKLEKHQEIAKAWDAQEQEIQQEQEKKKAISDITRKIDELNAINVSDTTKTYSEVKAEYDAAKKELAALITKYGEFNEAAWLRTKLTKIETEILPKLAIKESREEASKDTLSFTKLSDKLNALNNPEIKGILTQKLTPLNEQLKKWDSIKKLKEEYDMLQWKIDAYNTNWNESLDKDEKKWNRGKINELERKKKKIDKQIKEKEGINKDIVTELERIKGILNEPDNESIAKIFYWLWEWENVQDNAEKDWTPLKQYERNLVNIWEDQPDEVEDAPTNDPEDPEDPEDQDNSDIPAERADAPKASPDRVRRSTQSLWALLENLKTAFEQFKTWKWSFWWNLALLLDAFSWKTTTNDQLKDKDYIDSSNQEVTAILKEVMDKTNVNWLKEIKDVIEKWSEAKVRALQMKLWTPGKDLLITWKIDKATATALKEYVNDSSNNWAEENMTYQCLEWFDTDKATAIKDDAHNLDWNLYTKTEWANTETRFIWKINWKDCICINPTITTTWEWDSATTTMSFEWEWVIIQRADGVRQEWEFKFNDKTWKLELTKWKEYGKDWKSKDINPTQAEPDPQAPQQQASQAPQQQASQAPQQQASQAPQQQASQAPQQQASQAPQQQAAPASQQQATPATGA